MQAGGTGLGIGGRVGRYEWTGDAPLGTELGHTGTC